MPQKKRHGKPMTRGFTWIHSPRLKISSHMIRKVREMDGLDVMFVIDQVVWGGNPQTKTLHRAP